MKILILSLLVLSMSAFAAESTIKDDSNHGTLDITPTDKSDKITKDTATLSDKNGVTAHVTCKAKDGHELKQGDTGYEDCLKKVKSQKKNSKDPKAEVDVKFEK